MRVSHKFLSFFFFFFLSFFIVVKVIASPTRRETRLDEELLTARDFHFSMAADSTRLRHIEPYKVREIDDCAALAPLLFVAGVKRRVYLATINQPRRSTNGTNNTRVSSIDFNTFYLILFLPSHLFFINDETRFQTRVVFYRVFDEAFEIVNI